MPTEINITNSSRYTSKKIYNLLWFIIHINLICEYSNSNGLSGVTASMGDCGSPGPGPTPGLGPSKSMLLLDILGRDGMNRKIIGLVNPNGDIAIDLVQTPRETLAGYLCMRSREE